MDRCGNEVHPRSRGAAMSPGFLSPAVQGPSPLTRGSLQLLLQEIFLVGSIPAHAGQPELAAHHSPPVGVHPRSRGAARQRCGT